MSSLGGISDTLVIFLLLYTSHRIGFAPRGDDVREVRVALPDNIPFFLFCPALLDPHSSL